MDATHEYDFLKPANLPRWRWFPIVLHVPNGDWHHPWITPRACPFAAGHWL